MYFKQEVGRKERSKEEAGKKCDVELTAMTSRHIGEWVANIPRCRRMENRRGVRLLSPLKFNCKMPSFSIFDSVIVRWDSMGWMG
jgi:hypothetical protein